MNSYNDDKVLRSEVEETQFGLYTDDDIRKISVCRIISPITKDALGNPLHGGLYDPRMGVTGMSDSNCPTCNFGFVNCPGHPGHIELDHPIYHPLLFDSLFQILKTACLCCKRLRLNDTHIFPYLAKLKLLEMDEITEAEELDDKLWPSHQLDEVFDAKTDDENNNGSDDGDNNTTAPMKSASNGAPNAFASSYSSSVIASAAKKKFDVKNNSSSTNKANKDAFEDAQYTLLSDIDERYKRFVNRPNRAIPSVLARNKQRKIINDFMRHCLHVKKCENCDHITPGIRKDGYTKFFLRTMKSQKYKMKLKNRMKYGNKSAVLFWQDLLKREEGMKEQGIERLAVGLDGDDNDHEGDDMDAIEEGEGEGEGNDDINDDADDDEDGESEGEGEDGDGTSRKKKAPKVAPSDVFIPHAEVQAVFQLLWKYHGNEGILGHIWGRALRVSATSIEERFNADRSKKLSHYDKEVMLGNESWKLFFLSTVFVTPNRFRPEAVIGEAAAAHPQNVQLGKIVEINEAMRQLHILERQELTGVGLPGRKGTGGDDNSSSGSTSDGHSDSENSDNESDSGDGKKGDNNSSSAMRTDGSAMTTPVNSGIDHSSLSESHKQIITAAQYRINNALNATSATGKGAGASLAANAAKSSLSKNLMLLINLQTAVNCYMDGSKDPNPLVASWGHGIRQILEKKEGLFRKHMMGKRVNYCCRSVISPDPYIGTNEVGIPVHFAKSLHYPVPVTEWNAKYLRTLVERGPFEYPGANEIETFDGKKIKLEKLSAQERAAKAKLLLASPGNKVYRHLISGDLLLVNRQPSLHKASMMAHKARVLTHVKEQTIRLHYANCNSYNADFDGDEMNCHYVQSELARAECSTICNTDNQYIGPTSGSPLRGLIQDHVAGAVKLTCKNTFLDKEEFTQLLYIALDGLSGTKVVESSEAILIPEPTILKPKRRWTGKQIISALLMNLVRPPLPPVSLDGKTKTPATALGEENLEHKVLVRSNELLLGVLDKSSIGSTNLGLVHCVFELYGGEMTGLLLNSLGRLFTYYLRDMGHTCGIEDLVLTNAAEQERRDLLGIVKTKANEGLLEFLNEHVPSAQRSRARSRSDSMSSSKGDKKKGRSKADDGDSSESRVQALYSMNPRDNKVLLDGSQQGFINKSASDVIKVCLPNGLRSSFLDNSFSIMVLTGAKGSAVNQSQISCFLGQQALEGQRVPVMVSGKTLPSFKPYDSSIRAGGFVQDRFLTGVKPQEYYFHCMAGREGLVDTAVKTSRSGYLQRCLVKHLEELTVAYDMTVRDSAQNVIQFLYGEDGLDPTKSALLNGDEKEMLFLARNYKSFAHQYKLSEDYFNKIDLEYTSATDHNKMIRKATKFLSTDAVGNRALARGLSNDSAAHLKKAVVQARKRVNTYQPWTRSNIEKRWYTVEVTKFRPGSSDIQASNVDIKYDDGTVEKKVPLFIYEDTSPVTASSIHGTGSDGKDSTSKVRIPLISGGMPDTSMSVLSLNKSVGAIGEKLQSQLKSYIDSNPDKVIASDNLKDSFDNTRIDGSGLEMLLWVKFMQSLACPGEAVGSVAAQSVGEPSTQMTLNTFHLAGHGGANVTLGIPRLREIVMTASRVLKTPTMTIPLLNSGVGGGSGGAASSIEAITKRLVALEAKKLARRMGSVVLSDLLHHDGGLSVQESVNYNHEQKQWCREYQLILTFEDSKIIYKQFGINFTELKKLVQQHFLKRLISVLRKEQNKAGQSEDQKITNSMFKSHVNATPTADIDGVDEDGAVDVPEIDGEDGENLLSALSELEEGDGAKDAAAADEEADSDANPDSDVDSVLGEADEDDAGSDSDDDKLKKGKKGEAMATTDIFGSSDEEDDSPRKGKKAKKAKKKRSSEDNLGGDLDGDDLEGDDMDVDADVDVNVDEESNGITLVEQVTPASTKKGRKSETAAGVNHIDANEAANTMISNIVVPLNNRRMLMLQMAEQAAKATLLRSIKGITRAHDTKTKLSDGTEVNAVTTEGVNFEAAWQLSPEKVNHNEFSSNDIYQILLSYGVEAARTSIVNEIVGVFGVYGINVNRRHLSLIADFMTRNGSYVAMNRSGMSECSSPFLQMSFETTTQFLTRAANEGSRDVMQSPSSRIVLGTPMKAGTGCFDVRVPLKESAPEEYQEEDEEGEEED